ncbi:MAG TPA: 50S ribosomal protein L10, partial [bacterium]|nr:50S ribosomal protein L10 [bacterium]
RSFEALKMQDLNQFLKEPIGVVYSKGDIIVMSKFLVGYAKENEKFHVRAAWLDGRYCETDQIKVLASLPGRQELLSLLAGTLQAPISQLVCSLNAVITKLVLALEEIKKKKT